MYHLCCYTQSNSDTTDTVRVKAPSRRLLKKEIIHATNLKFSYENVRLFMTSNIDRFH